MRRVGVLSVATVLVVFFSGLTALPAGEEAQPHFELTISITSPDGDDEVRVEGSYTCAGGDPRIHSVSEKTPLRFSCRGRFAIGAFRSLDKENRIEVELVKMRDGKRVLSTEVKDVGVAFGMGLTTPKQHFVVSYVPGEAADAAAAEPAVSADAGLRAGDR